MLEVQMQSEEVSERCKSVKDGVKDKTERKDKDLEKSQLEIYANLDNLDLILHKAACVKNIIDELSPDLQRSLVTARELLCAADHEARASFIKAQAILCEDSGEEVKNKVNLHPILQKIEALEGIFAAVRKNTRESMVKAQEGLNSADANARVSFHAATKLLDWNPVTKRVYQRRDKVTREKSIMVGGKHKCPLQWSSSSRPYYFRRCKRVEPTSIESLPNELLFDILVRLPAAYLHHKARFVCRRWSKIISSNDFVNAQNSRSTYGLLLSNADNEPSFLICMSEETHPILVTPTQEGRIERHDPRYTCKTRFYGSSNGLALDMERKTFSLYISNPAINHELPLPSCSRPNIVAGRCSIGYAAASMVYKVTQPYYPTSARNYWSTRLAILTVGVDKSWREVEFKHLRDPKFARCRCLMLSLTTEGFIHWFVTDSSQILTLDVETEVLTISTFPYDSYETKLSFASTGRFLSVFVSHRDFSWEVWALKSGNGEWSKLLPDIELGGIECRLQQLTRENKDVLRPLGWVKYPEVLALYYDGCSRTCMFYNLVTREISSTELSLPVSFHCAYAHKNNLIRLS